MRSFGLFSAHSLLERVKVNAGAGAGVLLASGVRAEAYEPATFAAGVCERRLATVLGTALCPELASSSWR